MKIILSILFFLYLSHNAFAQEKNYPPPKQPPAVPAEDKSEPMIMGTAYLPPIYPGCELYKDNTRKLYQCFNQNFNTDLATYLKKFQLEKGSIMVFISFNVNSDGYLILKDTDVRAQNVPEKTNLESFESNVIAAFKELSKEIRNLGGIKPALNEHLEPSSMRYKIPVKFIARH